MSILDNPVQGDVLRYTEGYKEQDDPQVLADALSHVLSVPGVVAVRWSQYTPYFNDGDACVFGLGEVYWKFTDTPDNAGDYEDGFVDSYSLYENVSWSRGGGPAVYEYKNDFLRNLHEEVKRFEKVIDSGRQNVLLNKKFGDPANVTAYRDHFEIEEYEHD